MSTQLTQKTFHCIMKCLELEEFQINGRIDGSSLKSSIKMEDRTMTHHNEDVLGGESPILALQSLTISRLIQTLQSVPSLERCSIQITVIEKEPTEQFKALVINIAQINLGMVQKIFSEDLSLLFGIRIFRKKDDEMPLSLDGMKNIKTSKGKRRSHRPWTRDLLEAIRSRPPSESEEWLTVKNGAARFPPISQAQIHSLAGRSILTIKLHQNKWEHSGRAIRLYAASELALAQELFKKYNPPEVKE